MKVIVPLKRVIDFSVSIRVKPDKTGVVKDNVKMSMNPFDAIALEAAIQLKENHKVRSIIAVAMGQVADQDMLRQAYALGADEAVFIPCEQDTDPMWVADIVKQLVQRYEARLVIMGKQAIDNDANQTGQILAGSLGWAQGCFVSSITMNETHIEVKREIDAGIETLRLTLPAVLTTDLRLNEPRFPTLPNIMKAKSKPITILSLDELGVQPLAAFTTVSVTPPKPRAAGVILDSVDQLIDKLKAEGVLG